MKNKSKANYCSNCGTTLNMDDQCPQCNHIFADHHRQMHLCEYSDGINQCPAPGSLSHQTSGAGRWYCASHFKHIEDKATCNRILDDYQMNGVPQKIDWRDELIARHMNGEIDEKGEPNDSDASAA